MRILGNVWVTFPLELTRLYNIHPVGVAFRRKFIANPSCSIVVIGASCLEGRQIHALIYRFFHAFLGMQQ
jgi:hypothetical protein